MALNIKSLTAIVGLDFVSSNNSYLGFHRVQQQVSRLQQFLILDSESTINCILYILNIILHEKT